MMRFVFFLTFIFIAGVSCEQYTNKYDSLDLETIIKNDRLLEKYVDCLLDRGRCTREASELKKHIIDALETGCGKCSDRQLNGITRVVKYLAENKRDWWNELVRKYDPDGKYRRKYAELGQREGVHL